MWNNFSRVLALVNCCVSLAILQVFTPLYRCVKETLLIASTSKKSRLKLDQITNDLLSDLIIVLWRINFKFIPSMEKRRCRHNYCSCTSIHKNKVVEIVLVHFVQFVLFQRSLKNKHPMPSNPFELAVASSF